MEIAERSFQSAEYRYGFNGKENDREWGTGGLTQDYGFRLYNPGIGKFLSVDPISPDYPELTSYQFASNRPIDGVDLDGLEYQVKFRVIFDEQGIVLRKEVMKDYRNMNLEELKKVHKLSDTQVKAFYYNNAESFGKEGRGVMNFYYTELEDGTLFSPDGEEPHWEVKQDGILDQLKRHGIFYGPGTITLDGDREHRKPGNYDFSVTPIDMVDAIAKAHDMEQDYEGFKGWTHVQEIGGDIRFLRRLEMYLDLIIQGKLPYGDPLLFDPAILPIPQLMRNTTIDPYTNRIVSIETEQAARNAINLFSGIIQTKKYAIEWQHFSGQISDEEYDKLIKTIDKAETQDLTLPYPE